MLCWIINWCHYIYGILVTSLSCIIFERFKIIRNFIEIHVCFSARHMYLCWYYSNSVLLTSKLWSSCVRYADEYCASITGVPPHCYSWMGGCDGHVVIAAVSAVLLEKLASSQGTTATGPSYPTLNSQWTWSDLEFSVILPISLASWNPVSVLWEVFCCTPVDSRTSTTFMHFPFGTILLLFILPQIFGKHLAVAPC